MDMDIGEMLTNFMLNADLQVYCGVNISGLDLDTAIADRYW